MSRVIEHQATLTGSLLTVAMSMHDTDSKSSKRSRFRIDALDDDSHRYTNETHCASKEKGGNCGMESSTSVRSQRQLSGATVALRERSASQIRGPSIFSQCLKGFLQLTCPLDCAY
jgi:hypothetical protein